MREVHEPAGTVESSDVVVIGGGLAGLSAAVSAARLGSSVSLITNRPVLGGNSSSEVRVWVVGASSHGAQRFARETGIMDELFTENQYRNPEGNPILWDQVLLDLVRSTPGVKLYLNTDVHEVSTDSETGAISSVRGWTMDNEELTTFEAPIFVDATGDGLVGLLAGADFTEGRESKSEYGEEWAPQKADKELLGSSMFFYTKDVGHPVKYVAPNIALDITETSIPQTRIIKQSDSGGFYWWIEFGGDLNTIADNGHIRNVLASAIYGIWDYIKNSGKFDADNLTLEWAGNLPGRRESRRFLGDKVLTQDDVIGQTAQDDAVAYGGWSIDLHPKEGMFATDPGSRQRYGNGPYSIPFASLYSRNVPNLLLAGRDISASHIANGSARVMATCATEGQAVGTAAAIAARKGLTPRQIQRDHIGELQQTLLREDGSVLETPLADSDNLLASPAVRVSASSWQKELKSYVGIGAQTQVRPMDSDYAQIIPVESSLKSVSFLVDAAKSTHLTLQAWDVEKPQNYVPVTLLAERSVDLLAGTAMEARADFDLQVPSVRNIVVVLRRNPDISLHLTDVYPYGVMALRKKAESDVPFDPKIPDEKGELLSDWPAREMRGLALAFSVEGETNVYAPQHAVDEYQRPFGGPHMWMSQMDETIPSYPGRGSDAPVEGSSAVNEWIRFDLAAPTTAASVRLVLNDDTDLDLINLHHHFTPYRSIPTLLADYTVEVHEVGAQGAEHSGGRWVSVASVRNNRHRLRVHDFDQRTIDGVRVNVTCTNGVGYASISAVKLYAQPSGRPESPWK